MGYSRGRLLRQITPAHLAAGTQGFFMVHLVTLHDKAIAFSAYAYRFAAYTPG